MNAQFDQQFKEIHAATWEQLNSVGAVDGKVMQMFVLSLIYMKQIVMITTDLMACAESHGAEQEQLEIRREALSSLLSSLTLAYANAMDLKEDQLDTGFEWMETIYGGAVERLNDVFNKE